MRSRPFSLKFVAFFYLAISLALPLQIAVLYSHGISDIAQIWQKMTFFNWMIFALGPITAALVWIGHKSVKMLLPLNMIVVALNNWSVSHYGDDYSEAITITATLLFTMFNSILLFGRGLDAIIYPELQWWRVSQRIPCQDQKTLLSTLNGDLLEAQIFDISRTGLFLKQSDPIQGELIKPGEQVTLGLTLKGEENPLIITARVIRKCESKGHYPEGFGLCFDALKIKERLALFRYLKQCSSTWQGLAAIS